MSAEKFFTTTEKNEILSAIKEAELNTSGEIRVHIEEKVSGEVLDRAAYIFKNLGMHKTELRNGILFYLAFGSRKFAILGDAGINSRVPENFWDDIKLKMGDLFRDGNFAEGLTTGILLTGEQLKKHFPYQKDDSNELSDDLSFGQKE